jgi:major vault protein
MANDTQRDLVLAPGEYAYIQDRTQGAIKMATAPATVTPSQSDVPVKYDPKTGSFMQCGLDSVIQKNARADDGSYIILKNPEVDGKQPKPGMKGSVVEPMLRLGSKVVIPGPADFPLWPQQSAETIDGHHLKSNQFLLVRVYNEELANKNWSTAIMRPAAVVATQLPPDATEEQKAEAAKQAAAAAAAVTPVAKVDLTTGKLHVIKGTEVSFFIPPSGVEVVRAGSGEYVREALTLEQMEYCILVDENGSKRFEKGPQVVFPEPTEAFQVKDGAKKQNAIELNDLQGLHIKAIANCEANGTKFVAGQEYFITGKGTYDSKDVKVGPGVTIYYPQEELAFVKYDGKTKIFAVTVPEGEGRYVMNRITGEIETKRGPVQLLPNPCMYVVVRRVLTPKQVMLWYPGNQEALEYNLAIAGAAASSPTTRAGALSEGDFERATKGMMKSRGAPAPSALYASAVMNFAGETSRVSGDQKSMGDEFERSSGYTAPRTLTLNTKYQGAVLIEVWTGYAIRVISKTGDRRTVVGPQTVLLDYDETLEQLSFSTGKPKSTDKLDNSAYLRVENNKVADIIRVETSDHVMAEVYLSYKVNFTGPDEKWFSVENYVKYLCDHARSLVKSAVRKIPVEKFWTESTDILRDILLGEAEIMVDDTKGVATSSRPGLFFPENGMRVDDFEVLGVEIKDQVIRDLLALSAQEGVKSQVQLNNRRREVEVAKTRFQLEQEVGAAETALSVAQNKMFVERGAAELATALAGIANEIKKLDERAVELKKEQDLQTFESEQETNRKVAMAQAEIGIRSKEQELKLQELVKQTEAVVARFQSAQGGFSEALLTLSHNETLTKVAEAWSIQRVIGGDSVSDALSKVFAGSPLSGLVSKIINNGAAKPQSSVQPQA